MQLVDIKVQVVLLGQLLDDVQVLVLIRHGEGDLQTETVGQRGNGLEGIAHAHLIALTVGHALADEMTAVGRCVNDQIGRLSGQTALDKCLERGKVVVLAAEGQVIEEHDETERRTQGLLEQLGEIRDLPRRHLDDLQAAVGVLVGNRLDGRGLAGALVAVEQDVVGVASVEEGKRVLEDFLLLHFVAGQVVQTDGIGMHDRGRRAVVLHGKRRGLCEEAVALLAVVIGKRRTGGERKRVCSLEVRQILEGRLVELVRCGGLEGFAVEREQSVQHVQIVGCGVEHSRFRCVDGIGQGVGVKVHSVEHCLRDIAAGEACRAQCAVAVGKVGGCAVERGQRVAVGAHQRMGKQSAQHGKRAQTQGKGGKLHCFQLQSGL